MSATLLRWSGRRSLCALHRPLGSLLPCSLDLLLERKLGYGGKESILMKNSSSWTAATRCLATVAVGGAVASPEEEEVAAATTAADDRTDVVHEAADDGNDDHFPSTANIVPSKEFGPDQVCEDLRLANRWYTLLKGSARLNPFFVRAAVDNYEWHLNYIWDRLQTLPADERTLEAIVEPHLVEATSKLLSSATAANAMKVVIRCKVGNDALSQRVRELERLIGSIGMTPLTDALSMALLEANGRSGNVGRTLSLLQVRQTRGYPAKRREYEFAIRAIESAGLFLRKGRNIFIGDVLQPAIDNPTRWLDAILISMHQRGVHLDTRLVNRMLNTYASTGRTGKAIHFFYMVKRDPVDPDEHALPEMPIKRGGPIKLRLKFKDPPKYYKVPSDCRDVLVGREGDTDRRLQLDRETDEDWSFPLTAAFAFADSLTHGACGHAPIQLDIVGWNTLIKICCYRGSLWRAMQIIEESMPRQGIKPDSHSYSTLLSGLARVGDVKTMQEIFQTMTNKGVPVDKYTVQAMADGKLNLGDIAGAVTIVQDIFNQHCAIPPYTTHLKIIEFALASDLLHEAKRHVCFLQQMWKWEPNSYHNPDFTTEMELTKKNPKLSKMALIKLFAYFGETLNDDDFF